MNVEFDKKSLRKLQKQLGEVLKKDKEATFQGMVDTGYEIHAEAVNKCPVDTGHLRAHIEVEKDRKNLVVLIGTNVKYAPFVEFGTRKMRAQPYLRPAFENNIGHLISNIKRLIKR